jgi:hypothetical protein
MKRSRLDMNTARDRTITIAVTGRTLGWGPGPVPAFVGAWELTGAFSWFVRNLDLL